METTVITASIMGPIMLLIGIGLFINTKFYKGLISDVKTNKGLIIIPSILGMIGGNFLVTNHNMFLGTPELIIFIIGCIMLIKSAFMLALPSTITKLVKHMKFSFNTLKTEGLIYITIGLYLVNYAYYGV